MRSALRCEPANLLPFAGLACSRKCLSVIFFATLPEQKFHACCSAQTPSERQYVDNELYEYNADVPHCDLRWCVYINLVLRSIVQC